MCSCGFVGSYRWLVSGSGGGIEIMVTSTKENKVAPVREAFQETFSRVRVTGVVS